MQKNYYGFHSISPLVWQNPQSVITLYVDKTRKDKRVNELLEIAKQNEIEIALLTAKELDKLCGGGKHQGIAAKVELEENSDAVLDVKQLLKNLSEVERATVVILDGITDPHNLGAIIRSCDCFGVDAIILPKDNSASINPTVAKVSAGAVNNLPIIVVNNLVRVMEDLQEAGFWIAGTALDDTSVDLFDFQPSNKMVWVMGNEGSGIRRLVAETCDYLVSIPMSGKTQSLNVSVATGVVLSYGKYKGK